MGSIEGWNYALPSLTSVLFSVDRSVVVVLVLADAMLSRCIWGNALGARMERVDLWNHAERWRQSEPGPLWLDRPG